MRILRAAVAVAVLMELAACGGSPTPSPGVDGSAHDTAFELRIHADQATYHAADAIIVAAQLEYQELAPDVTVYGSRPLVGFGISQLDGQHLHIGPVNDLVCGPQTIGRLAPVAVPFAKSGGFTADDPDAAFWQSWFADPVLHLPAGTWRIDAVADFTTGKDCTLPRHSLQASVTITVLP